MCGGGVSLPTGGRVYEALHRDFFNFQVKNAGFCAFYYENYLWRETGTGGSEKSSFQSHLLLLFLAPVSTKPAG